MTDEFGAADRGANPMIVDAAIRMAQHISRSLRMTRRPESLDEAEREAILREAFEGAAVVMPFHEGD
jgi:hypothetical protein